MGETYRPTRRTMLRLGVAGVAGVVGVVGYSATASALANTLRVEAVGEAASYEFTVSGALEPGPDFDTDGTDAISGSSATGTIAGTSGDDYTFSGELTDFSYEGDLDVFVNGDQIDPDTLGSGSEDSDGSGSNGLTNELIVSDPDGSQPNDYEFTVSGEVERLDDPRGDEADGDSASGTVYDGRDGYRFSGEVTTFTADGTVEVTIDGERVDPDTLGEDSEGGGDPSDLTNELIVSDPDGSQPNDYEFTVNGIVEALDDPRGDHASGDSARGTVYGGRDGYRFSGEITSFVYDGDVDVTINGRQVDPGSLGDGDGDKGGGDGKARVILSFDDGVPSAESVAKPIMDRYGYPGVMGIVTGRTQQSGDDPENLTVEELREMHADGWEIASHTIDHTKLTSVSRREVRRQCRESREFIAENGLLPTDPTLIYPYGGVNDRVVEIAADFFDYGFGGGDDDPTDGIDAPLDIDRARGHDPRDARDQIDRAIANDSNGVSVLMFHRIGTFTDPNPNDTSRREFVDLMEYIDARSDEIRVVTSSDL